MYCSHCGDIYRRIKWNNRGCKSTVWRCVSRVEAGGPECTARTVKEEDLQAAVVDAVNKAYAGREGFMESLLSNIESVISGGIEDRLKDVSGRIRTKQAELLEAGKDEEKVKQISEEITSLQNERQDILTESALKQDYKERMEDMVSFLNGQTEAVTEYSEALTRRLVGKITVYDEMMTVEFKSGMEIDIKA